MIRPTGNYQTVKREIVSYLEREVRVHVDLGRNKSAEFTGTK